MKVINGKIKEFRAASAREFWDLLSPERPLFRGPSKVLFRGQADASWTLNPSLFRADNNPALLMIGGAVTAEWQVAGEWMSLDQFVSHCDSSGLRIPNDSAEFRAKYLNQRNLGSFARDGSLWPREDLFELMALAQHHGLPTRLLDWSERSYVAAYFAASNALANKARRRRLAVWALNIELKAHFKELAVVRVPGSNSANIAAQAGVFTLLRQRKVEGISRFRVPWSWMNISSTGRAAR